jgi:hypothetical protein
MTEGLDLTLLLISIAAPIGALDVIYYHIYKFRLARRPESWNETKTHIGRGLMLAIVTVILMMYRPTGLWFWLIAGLFVVDLVNSNVDAYLERDSRAALGGLPRLEYVIHITGSTSMGAIAAAFLIQGWSLGALPTELGPRPTELPLPLAINCVAVAVGATLLAAYEAVVMASSMRQHRARAGA